MNLELEIFRNLFVSIAEEMGIVLRRTSFSPNIKERRDYSCAVYDHQAETIAMGDHMPAHLGAMPQSVTETLRSQTLEPGDLVLLNDPFRGGTHLPDITSVSAIFLDGATEPAYYLATRAHHSDVGGMMPGSMPPATDIFQEGLRIPPVKLLIKGELDDDLLQLILLNVRTPEERMGDLGAQIAAHRVGERRLLDATRKYGAEKMQAEMSELKDYSERLMRARLREIPDGMYEFEDFMDDDGFRHRIGANPLPAYGGRGQRNCGLSWLRAANAWGHQCEFGSHDVVDHVLFPLLDPGGHSLQRRYAAPDRDRHRAGHFA